MQSATQLLSATKIPSIRLGLSDIARILDVPVVIATYNDVGNVRNHSTFGLDLDVNWSEFAATVDALSANGVTIVPNVEAHAQLSVWTATLVAGDIRFFAGIPLNDSDGYRVGSIAVLAKQKDVARKGIKIRQLGELGREFAGLLAAPAILRRLGS
jgi:hypothetical protein